MVDETAAQLLHKAQAGYIELLQSGFKFVGEEFRNDVMNVEDQARPLHFRVPGREDQEIRHVMDVHHVVAIEFVQPGENGG